MKTLITIFFALVLMRADGQRSRVVFEATFENPQSLQAFDSVAQCHNNISISDSIKRAGSKSVKFTLLAGDTAQCSNLRSQLKKTGGPTNYEAWYGFSVYFADSYPLNYDGVESFFQFYRDTSDFMPPLTLNYNGFYNGSGAWPSGKYITLVQNLVSPAETRAGSPYTEYHFPLDTVPFNKWVDVVMNVKWSNDTTGFIRVWINNELRFVYSGVNNYTPNYLRIGADKMDWRKNWNVSSTSFRVLYMDEVRIGDAQAQYLDVLPGTGGNPLPLGEPRPPRPYAREATPLTLVNPSRNGRLQLNIPATVPERMSYEIMDASGRVLLRNALSIVRGNNYKEIDISGLTTGLYFFALQSNAGLTVKKVVKL